MKDENEIFHRIIDEITSDLDGMPVEVDRGDKENLVLVSAATYHGLIQKIYALEHAVMTDDERTQEEKDLLLEMLGALEAGRMN